MMWLSHPDFKDLILKEWNDNCTLEDNKANLATYSLNGLDLGDKNTMYYHASTIVRKCRNKVKALKGSDEI